MSNNGKRTPKLRFPEFRNDGNWKDAPLSDLCDRIIEKVGEVQLTPVSITAGRGYVSQAEKFGRDISGAQYKNYIYLRRGDFAYNKGNSNLYPQGCVYRLKEFDEAAASNAFICFKLRDGNAPGFFEGLFEKNTHGRQLVRFLTSGARSDGLLNIKAEEFFSVQFPLPPRSAEQQKIADCLSSLDELIAAEGRKLESLRAYKKGLMQQLFPRDGETTPLLRFPEFRNAGVWEKKPLGEIAEIKLGKMLDNGKEKTGRLLPYLNNISLRWNEVDTSKLPHMYFDEDEFDRFGLKADDVVVCEGGEPGRSAVWDGRIPELKFQKAIHRVRFNVPYEPRLLVFYLETISGSSQFEMLFTGGGIKHLTRETFATLSVPLASLAEQQRAVDCLSSLDTHIASQYARIAALRTHKKGLMQKLFPSPEGRMTNA